MNDQKRQNADKILRFLWENYQSRELKELHIIASKLDIDREEAETALIYLYKRKFVESQCKPMGNGDVIDLSDDGYLFMNDTNLMEEKNKRESATLPSNIYNIAGNANNFGNHYNGENSVQNNDTPQNSDSTKKHWIVRNKEIIVAIIVIIGAVVTLVLKNI